MGELTFTVIGVFRERVSTFGLSEIKDESVIIPLTLMKYYTGTEVLRVLYAQAERSDQVESVERGMSQILHSRHPAGAEYDVQTLTAILSAAKNISLALTIVLSVDRLHRAAHQRHRHHEHHARHRERAHARDRHPQSHRRRASRDHVSISIRSISHQRRRRSHRYSRRPRDSRSCSPFLPGNLRVPVSTWSVIASFVVSCSTGLLFGYLPANQAARMQPIESLRYE